MKHRRRIAAMLLAGAATAAAIAGTGAPAQAAQDLRINIWNSNHCLDNATQDDARLQMWKCGGGSEQRWVEELNIETGDFRFHNKNSDFCVTAPEDGPGTITMTRCDPSKVTQLWFVLTSGGDPTNRYRVWESAWSGLCMTTPSVGDGTLVRATECDPNDQYDRWHEQV